MDKKVLKQYSVNIWDKTNWFLFVTTIALVMLFLALFIACFIKRIPNDCHNTILGMCGIFASLSSAFFIAWYVRFYELKSQRAKEQKALELIYPYLLDIFLTINEFLPHLKYFTKINDDDTIIYSKETIYFKDSDMDSKNCFFVNLDMEFKNTYSILDINLEECLSLPIIYQCNEKIIKLLTEIKTNGLTSQLVQIFEASSKSEFVKTSFCGLKSNYNKFIRYYNELAVIVNGKQKGELVELTSEERSDYLKEIEKIKQMISSAHEGKIYFNGNQIQ
ncbi:MAG: hypothetical protein IJ872_00320 [Eubacterium sp.]|nr:hypothetical protein [Eubacterium sp.]